MKALKPVFNRQISPGIYHLTSRAKPTTVLNAVSAHGWMGLYLDGSPIADKASFLDAVAAIFEFPNYFGCNWDAFEECITDLEWIPADGYVLLYDQMAHFANHDPRAWEVARTILDVSIAYWHRQAIPFYVLLRGTWWHGRAFPNL